MRIAAQHSGHQPRSLAAQCGMTMIELMISISIGLVMTLAILQVFQGNKLGFSTQEGMSDVQEVGRFAVQFLNANIRQVGYISNSTIEPSTIYPGTTAANRAVTGTDEDGAGDSDTLTVRYQGFDDGDADINDDGDGFGDVLDCQGNVVPRNVVVTSTYFLQNEIAGDNTSPLALKCTRNSALLGSPDTDIVLSNVTSFEILYGVDVTPDDDNPAVNRYVTAAAVTDWTAVRAIELSLTVESANEVVQTGNPSDPMAALSQSFTTVVDLRNNLR